MEINSILILILTLDILALIIFSKLVLHVQTVKNSQFISMEVVCHIVHQILTLMEEHVLSVKIFKDGMEHNVLIDVQMEEYGITKHNYVTVQ
jgi:hypothetical protein